MATGDGQPTWSWLWQGVASNGVSAALGAAITAAWSYSKVQRSKYAGRWRFTIRWDHQFATQRLFGQPVHDPYSIGEVALAYGAGPKAQQYWGLGQFTLHDGEERYAQ